LFGRKVTLLPPTLSPPPSGQVERAEQTRWFADEVQPHGGKLKAYLRGSFPSIQDVDDVVQESYLRIWRRRLVGPVTSAQSYLYKIARNLALDLIRRRSILSVEPLSTSEGLDVLDAGPGAAESACTSEEIELLLKAIEALPPRCREVVILRKLRGFTPREIADRLGIAEGTVHIHGGVGVRRIEQFLRERGVEGGKIR